MSTFFGQNLPLTDLSSFFSEFYSPFVPDIEWKNSEN